jgi:hypothetical protein
MPKKFTQYKQGRFIPQNKDKYKGLTKIHYRSSWERSVCIYLDNHPHCHSWNFESTFIRYFDPCTKKDRKYIMDFSATFRTKDGTLQTYLIEVKPSRSLNPPKRGRMKERNYLLAVATYKTNQAKWQAAKAFAQKRGYRFIILTEKELYHK